MPTAAGSPVLAAESPPDGPKGLPLADALALVDEAAKRLWTPEGAAALRYLIERRGLSLETIRRHRLGWTPRVKLPTSDGARAWRASGIVIPWLDGDRLELVKIRQPDGREPRYAQAFAADPNRPRIYPGPEAIRPGTPLVIVEGEFDAMIRDQEIGDLASVITTGSASTPLDPSMLPALLRCPQWHAAHDSDDAGDGAAAEWPARAVRVRPPEGCKDWGELHATGFNRIRYLWGGILRRPATPWDELAKERWGPGLTIEGAGFDTRRIIWPASPWHPADEDDRMERDAIRTEHADG
jgi:hypothetical protein